MARIMPAKKKGMHRRTLDKIHIMVRLELANPLLSQIDLAKLAGLPYIRYTLLKRTTVYQQIHNQYLTGVLTKLDNQVEDNLKVSSETLKFAVPLALQALVQQALQTKDLRVQNKACNDILDRDGHFAKVTRVGLATPDQGGVANEKDNQIASELIKALEANKAASSVGVSTPPTTAPSIDTPPLTDSTQ